MSATASCHFPYLNEWKQYCDKNKILAFTDAVLSGYAQLAFNDNTFSGILMIIATWIGSPVVCISALWGTIIATLSATLLGAPKEQIRAGIYGANAALSGLAVQPLLFPGQSLSFMLLGVSGTIAIMTVLLIQLLSKYFAKWNLPSLVVPYCICLIFFLGLFTILGITNPTPVTFETLLFTTSLSKWSAADLLIAYLNCAAEILWLVNPLSGILYLIALTFASRLDTINTLVAITISLLVSTVLGLPKDAVISGLYGYNAILLMQVLTRGFLITKKSYLLNVCAVAITPIICCIYQLILPRIGIGSFLALPYLTVVYVIFANRKRLRGFTYVPAKHWGVPETISLQCTNIASNCDPK